MKKILPYTLSLGLLCLASCHKDNSTKPLPPLDSAAMNRDININLTYNDYDDSLHENMWEVIVNEPGGQVLLDSVARANVNISALLRAHGLLVDLTVVYYSAQYDDYTTITYRNVDPTQWTGVPGPGNNFGIGVDKQTGIASTVNYVHPPALNSPDAMSIGISDYIYASGVGSLNYQPGYSAYQPGGLLSVNYTRFGNGPIYTEFLQTGLYNIHTPPVTGNDTVDLTHMDTAAMVNYTIPQGYSKSGCFLYGFTDTTDLDKSMMLTFNLYNTGLPADLEFPSRGFQTYLMNMNVYGKTTTEVLNYSTYGPTISSTINWITAADYTLNAKLQDSFSVSFGPSKPSLYRVDYTSGSNYFEIYSAPDGQALHPYTWFTHLNSKLLQGQNLSALAPSYFFVEQAQGFGEPYIGLLNFYAKPTYPNRYPSGVAATTYQTGL